MQIAVLAALLLLLALLVPGPGEADRPLRRGRVVAVFDGDTVLLASGERVRYLGIDAPEMGDEENPPDCHAGHAREANRRLVQNRELRLEYDDRVRDKYGRLLAYVFSPDGTLVNAELIRNGHAWIYRDGEGFSRFETFLALQKTALAGKLGLWGDCAVREEAGYVGNRRSFVFHRPDCPSVEEISGRNRIPLKTRREAFERGCRPCRHCMP